MPHGMYTQDEREFKDSKGKKQKLMTTTGFKPGPGKNEYASDDGDGNFTIDASAGAGRGKVNPDRAMSDAEKEAYAESMIQQNMDEQARNKKGYAKGGRVTGFKGYGKSKKV